MSAHQYVAIEGVIGVGKTTLVRLLQPTFQAQPLLELFDENPFLADFYGDRARYAFQTQTVFLLSRYRQQHKVIPEMLRHGNVISDYMFAKDRIFAHANLTGDELDTYDRLHAILGETVATPDLIVYLHADLPVLLQRIAIRDRSFERGIDPDYLELLRRSYEEYFAHQDHAPVLTVNTNDLDYVHDGEALQAIAQRVRNALGQGTHQPSLIPPQEMDVRGVAVPHSPGNQTRGVAPGVSAHAPQALLSMLQLQEQLGLLAAGLASSAQDTALAAPLGHALRCLIEIAENVGVDLAQANAPTASKRDAP